MKLHVLRCGTVSLPESAAFGGKPGGLRRLLTREGRVELPVFCYLVEHRHGLILVDTGLSREMSPAGVYDKKAAEQALTPQLAAFYRPRVPMGMTAAEQLADRGILPQDLDLVILTHLDPDHVAGLSGLRGAKKILLPEDEYFWSCRTVYKRRQPWKLWMDADITHVFYRGSSLGPNRWAIDVFGDESLQLVNVPGHTDGQCAVILREGARFVILAADAAFSPRNWREDSVPGFGFDRDLQRRSLRWLAEMEKDPGCAAILCSHDPAVEAQVMEF